MIHMIMFKREYLLNHEEPRGMPPTVGNGLMRDYRSMKVLLAFFNSLHTIFLQSTVGLLDHTSGTF
jgi:hypothetical protein